MACAALAGRSGVTYDGSRIGAGARIEGPALIEETTTTLLVQERQGATTDVYGNYHVEAAS